MSIHMIVYFCSLGKHRVSPQHLGKPWGPNQHAKDSFMNITSSAKLAARTVLAIFAISLVALGQSVEGTWDATVTLNNVSVPFTIEIDGSGTELHSYFFNGDDRVNPSNSGTFQN